MSILSQLRNDLEAANDRIAFLEGEVQRLEGEHGSALDRALNRAIKAEEQRSTAWKQLEEARKHPPLFERMAFEKFTREQLVSFIEQGVNEARRKGMVEAEGLLSRHRELSEDTDLEMMKGVVAAYGQRIAEIEARRAAEKEKEVKLDRRPLREKLKAAASRREVDFKAFDNRAMGLIPTKVNTLADGVEVIVAGDHGTMYRLGRRGDVYACSCPSWVHQPNTPNDRRTCKHLQKYLGAQVEEKRITKPQPSCWCGVLLVRGQCQVHTVQWKGDERCNCGRLFSFCNDEYRRGKSLTQNYHTPWLQGTQELLTNKRADVYY